MLFRSSPPTPHYQYMKRKIDLPIMSRNQQRTVNRLVTAYQPDVRDQRIYRERLTNNTSAVSNSITGNINTVVSMNPSGSGEWTSMANLYEEFRVLGIRIRLVSKQQFSVTAINDGAVICYDNTNSTVLTGTDAGLQYNTSHLFPAVWAHTVTGTDNKAGVLEFTFMRPSAGRSTPIDWIPTSTPANSLGSVKFFASSLTTSTNYWVIFIDYFIEFRARN